MRSRRGLFFATFIAVLLCGVFLAIPSAHAQQTLGGITGTVFDSNGGAIPATKVTADGYVMDTLQINAVPLPTGSFTGLALLAPGVNAELSAGTGANEGLGNAPVWANGQRDTSNSYLLNGVDARNLFNGKSTSQVASARVVNNTGIGSTSALRSVPVQK